MHRNIAWAARDNPTNVGQTMNDRAKNCGKQYVGFEKYIRCHTN